MARQYARINISIWSDDEFRALTFAEQNLYFTIISDPRISWCGIAEWSPKRMVPKAVGWTVELINAAAYGLMKAKFIVIDINTDEVFVRSFLRHNDIMSHSKLCVAGVNAIAEIASNELRAVAVHELLRLQDESPAGQAWTRPAVRAATTRRAVSVEDATEALEQVPVTDDFSSTFSSRFSGTFTSTFSLNASERLGVGLGVPYNCNSNKDNPRDKSLGVRLRTGGREAVGAAPVVEQSAPAAGAAGAPTLQSESGPATTTKRGSRIPEDFPLTDERREWAKQNGYETMDIETETLQFIDYWESVPGKRGIKTNWDAVWRNWIRNAHKYQSERRNRPNTQNRKVDSDDRLRESIALVERLRALEPNNETLPSVEYDPFDDRPKEIES